MNSYFKSVFEDQKYNTAWKLSKYGVISIPYFPVFSQNTGKYEPEITPYLDNFHAVPIYYVLFSIIISELLSFRGLLVHSQYFVNKE